MLLLVSKNNQITNRTTDKKQISVSSYYTSSNVYILLQNNARFPSIGMVKHRKFHRNWPSVSESWMNLIYKYPPKRPLNSKYLIIHIIFNEIDSKNKPGSRYNHTKISQALNTITLNRSDDQLSLYN